MKYVTYLIFDLMKFITRYPSLLILTLIYQVNLGYTQGLVQLL